MSFKLLLPVFFYALLQCQATNVTKMVYVISGHTYYSSNLTGELSYELLSLETTDIPTKQKNEMYKLGQKLRSTYGKVLENLYNSQVYTMHTSETTVSMMTGLLINAGIWPPVKNQIWSDDELLWQPVPYEYDKMDQDEVLAGTLCPSLQLAVKNSSTTNHSNETDKIFHNVINQIKAEYPKLIIKDRLNLLMLYYILRSKDISGENLPIGVRNIYNNETFVSLALEALKDLSKTPLQKQLNGGTFLKKVLNDFGDFIVANYSANEVTKVMTVYSGDEINIAGILAGLEVQLSKISYIPRALIFELIYDRKLKSYIIVIKSQDKNLDKEPKVLAIHGCKVNNCTFEHFQKTIAALIPKDEVQLCGRNDTNIPGTEPIAPDSNKHRNFASKSTFSFLLLYITIVITAFVIFK